jgi:hypothetical protein
MIPMNAAHKRSFRTSINAWMTSRPFLRDAIHFFFTSTGLVIWGISPVWSEDLRERMSQHLEELVSYLSGEADGDGTLSSSQALTCDLRYMTSDQVPEDRAMIIEIHIQEGTFQSTP